MAVQALLESFANRNVDLDLSMQEGVDLLSAAVAYSAMQGGEDLSVTSFFEKTGDLEIIDWSAELELNSRCGALEGTKIKYYGDIEEVLIKLEMPNGNKVQTGLQGSSDALREQLKARFLA